MDDAEYAKYQALQNLYAEQEAAKRAQEARDRETFNNLVLMGVASLNAAQQDIYKRQQDQQEQDQRQARAIQEQNQRRKLAQQQPQQEPHQQLQEPHQQQPQYCNSSGTPAQVSSAQSKITWEYLPPPKMAASSGANNKGGCFSGSTEVMTPQGEKKISELKVGDVVCSWNAASNELTVQPVTKIVTHDTANLSKLSYEGRNEPVSVTSNHPVLTDKGWTRVGNLVTGDKLQVLVEGKPQLAAVTGLEKGNQEPVYNLHTRGDHNFVADGLVANNFIHLRRLQTLANKVVEKIEDHIPGAQKHISQNRILAPIFG